MSKSESQYVCESCGAVRSKWSGKCDACGEWSTLTERATVTTIGSKNNTGTPLATTSLQHTKSSSKKHDRQSIGLPEVDQVLGGGFVPGSVTLIAGEPGIGKSTLLLQLAYLLSQSYSVLYVSAEESEGQVGLRAQRLGARAKRLELAASSSADDIAATIATGTYSLVIVDSIQTIACSMVSSAVGSVSQITSSAQLLSSAAKQTDTSLIIVGHVTKQGAIAGPKILEHLVDVVLNLEGDRYGGLKLLRGVKNRYGSTHETGIFDMTDTGLKPVENPSQAMLEERQVSDGSVVLATMEGSRPLLVEVQALVNSTQFGYPKRTASGFDLNRLNLLLAVLERRTKLSLADKDVYVNIVGGMRITEPAADLAVCMAIASAAKGMMLKEDAIVFGEVGLSGEVRHVQWSDKRIAEGKKLGFKQAIGPRTKDKTASSFKQVSTIREALNSFLTT